MQSLVMLACLPLAFAGFDVIRVVDMLPKILPQPKPLSTDVNKHVIYDRGHADSTVIITVPHGGSLGNDLKSEFRPSKGCWHKDNNDCVYYKDCYPKNTKEDRKFCKVSNVFAPGTMMMELLAQNVAQFVEKELNVKPHLIRCRTHPSIVDVNTHMDAGTFGKPLPIKIWKKYHAYIEEAKAAASAGGRKVLYIDLLSQTKTYFNLVGHLLEAKRTTKAGMNKPYHIPDRLAQYSSIMQLHVDSGVSMEELVRGENSTGGLLNTGYYMAPGPDQKVTPPIVRASRHRKIITDGYHVKSRYTPRIQFQNGYSLRRHTGYLINGFQVETSALVNRHYRFRINFASQLARSIKFWVENFLNKGEGGSVDH